MKKRTNKWWLALSVLAMCAAPALVACSDDDNEITVVTPEIGISQFTISAVGGESTLAITPTADWQAESKTSWLALSPASGTVNDKEIKLTVQPNTTFESRTATIEMTVGTAKMTKTIVQEGVQKYISIYSDKITFAMDDKSVMVSPIITNVAAMEVISYPSWVESVSIVPETGGYYSAEIVLKAADYDSELRQDTVIFGDGEGFTQKFPLECSALKNKLISMPDLTAFTGDAQTFDVTIFNPEADSQGDTILFYNYVMSMVAPFNAFNKAWLGMSPQTAAPSSAVEGTVHKVYLYELNSSTAAPSRQAAMFVIPKEEVAEFNFRATTYQPYIITQNNAYITPTWNPADYTIGSETSFTISLTVKEGTQFDAKLLNQDFMDWGENLDDYLADWLSFEQVGDKVTNDGKDVYTYKVNVDFPMAVGRAQAYLSAVLKDDAGNYIEVDVDGYPSYSMVTCWLR